MDITKTIKYVGVNDYDVDLFEGQYIVPNGMAYNSYVILDEKIAVMDTVDARFGDEWLANVEKALDGKKPSYLIVQHVEPDHSANIPKFLQKYPEAVVVGIQNTFKFVEQFYGEDLNFEKYIINNGDQLSLGEHNLTFVFAPMVHWPEVFVTFDSYDKVLFSADGFGKFGALDADEEWDCEARRYYFGIVGKYGAQVQNLLKAASSLDIQIICPLHGPILKENLEHYISQYDTWSSYKSETKGVCIIYASLHGNTKEAAELLAKKLTEKGCEKVAISDIAREDMAECVEDAFRYDRLILMCPTYNMGIFPDMYLFIHKLEERNFQNKKVGLVENGTWAPQANKVMKGLLEDCKNLEFFKTEVTIKSALNDESIAALDTLANEICTNKQQN